jgi:hypothetical protein
MQSIAPEKVCSSVEQNEIDVQVYHVLIKDGKYIQK